MSDLSDFCMPTLGADMEKGTLLEWLVKPGDEVHRGQVIAEVDTAKSAIGIEVFEDGVVDEILVPEGQEVRVGTVLARLRPAAARAVPRLVRTPTATTTPAGMTTPAPARPPATLSPVLRRLAERLHVDLGAVAGTGHNGKITRADIVGAVKAPAPLSPAPRPQAVRASPLARRRAAAAGVDLAQLTGSGPDGAVTVADVEAALSGAAASSGAAVPAPPIPEPAAHVTDRQAAMRQMIGALVSRSKREIPHYYLATTIDLQSAMTWLRQHNAGLPVTERILPVAVLLKATAVAAAAYPEMNGHFVDGGFRPATQVRLGVPVALRSGGLVTPAIEAAEQLTVAELNQRLRDLATRAKAGRLRGSELGDPTLTVTNLGDQGVEAVYGVIFPPQVALVGFGSIVERPWAVEGLLGVRPVVTATLSADHRVSDGHRGALFLNAIAENLNQPEEL